MIFVSAKVRLIKPEKNVLIIWTKISLTSASAAYDFPTVTRIETEAILDQTVCGQLIIMQQFVMK